MQSFLKEIKDEDLMAHTQQSISRGNLKKKVRYERDSKYKQVAKEYMNYAKYDKNYISYEDDFSENREGRESDAKHVKNYHTMLERLNLSHNEHLHEEEMARIK